MASTRDDASAGSWEAWVRSEGASEADLEATLSWAKQRARELAATIEADDPELGGYLVSTEGSTAPQAEPRRVPSVPVEMGTEVPTAAPIVEPSVPIPAVAEGVPPPPPFMTAAPARVSEPRPTAASPAPSSPPVSGAEHAAPRFDDENTVVRARPTPPPPPPQTVAPAVQGRPMSGRDDGPKTEEFDDIEELEDLELEEVEFEEGQPSGREPGVDGGS